MKIFPVAPKSKKQIRVVGRMFGKAINRGYKNVIISSRMKIRKV